MDKFFILFIGSAIIFGFSIMLLSNQSLETSYDKEIIATSTTVTTLLKITTTSINEDMVSTISDTTTSTTSTSTTTTTIPRYIGFNVTDIGRCANTIRGKMNTILAELSSDRIDANWGYDPDPRVFYTCDSSELIEFEKVMLTGGKSIEPFNKLAGSYRLATKCGRNQVVEDLRDCKQLTVYIESYYVNTSSQGIRAKKDSDQITTTTIYHNPYLDRFRGQGYRKADFDIAWMCPTCVPAVNKLVRDEIGVKSKSLGYGQELNYIIYNPDDVDLERLTQLCNAGGTAILLNDTEI